MIRDHGHGEPLQADARNGPLFGQQVGEACFVVAFKAANDGMVGFVHSRRFGRPHLRGTGDGGDVEHALADLIGQALGENVFQVRAGVGQVR